MSIVEQNRQRDLYFVDEDRIIFIPKDWCDEFQDDSGDEPSIYGWIGQPSVNNWLSHPQKAWNTYDAQGWVPISELEKLRQVDEQEARRIDPDLFRLMDAVNSGEAH